MPITCAYPSAWAVDDFPTRSFPMDKNKSPSVAGAAYMLGVDYDTLEAFVNHHNPKPNSPAAKGENVFSIGDEMARTLDSLNPSLAQKWRTANYMARRQAS